MNTIMLIILWIAAMVIELPLTIGAYKIEAGARAWVATALVCVWAPFLLVADIIDVILFWLGSADGD